MVAYHYATPHGQTVPNYPLRRKIEHQVAKSAHEHLLIFTDAAKKTQIWQWVKRETGKPIACREHIYHHTQTGDALLHKLEAIAFSLDEEERLTLPEVLAGLAPDLMWSASPSAFMTASSRSTPTSCNS
jgi:hypothetical protein